MSENIQNNIRSFTELQSQILKKQMEVIREIADHNKAMIDFNTSIFEQVQQQYSESVKAFNNFFSSEN